LANNHWHERKKVLGGHIDYRRASRCRADVVQVYFARRGIFLMLERTPCDAQGAIEKTVQALATRYLPDFDFKAWKKDGQYSFLGLTADPRDPLNRISLQSKCCRVPRVSFADNPRSQSETLSIRKAC
jgi:hypothetical protein